MAFVAFDMFREGPHDNNQDTATTPTKSKSFPCGILNVEDEEELSLLEAFVDRCHDGSDG